MISLLSLCYISALSHNHQHHHHPHSRNYRNGSLIYAIVSEPRVNAAPLGGLRVRSGSKSEHVKIAFCPGLVPRNPIRSKFVINKAASHRGVIRGWQGLTTFFPTEVQEVTVYPYQPNGVVNTYVGKRVAQKFGKNSFNGTIINFM